LPLLSIEWFGEVALKPSAVLRTPKPLVPYWAAFAAAKLAPLEVVDQAVVVKVGPLPVPEHDQLLPKPLPLWAQPPAVLKFQVDNAKAEGAMNARLQAAKMPIRRALFMFFPL